MTRIPFIEVSSLFGEPSPDRLMRVELFGQAGSGKTTLARSLEQALTDGGRPVTAISRPGSKGNASWIGRRMHDLSSASDQWPIVQSALSLLARCHALDRQHLGLAFELARRSSALNRAPISQDTVEIVDEGVLHGVWSLTLGLADCDESAVRRLARQLPWPNVAISIRVDPRQAYNRILTTKSSHRIQDMEESDALRALDRQAEILGILEDCAPSTCETIAIADLQIDVLKQPQPHILNRVIQSLKVSD